MLFAHLVDLHGVPAARSVNLAELAPSSICNKITHTWFFAQFASKKRTTVPSNAAVASSGIGRGRGGWRGIRRRGKLLAPLHLPPVRPPFQVEVHRLWRSRINKIINLSAHFPHLLPGAVDLAHAAVEGPVSRELQHRLLLALIADALRKRELIK